MSAGGNGNTNANPDNIISTTKETKLYVPVVTLLTKDNQKLSKLLSKGFQRSVYCAKVKHELQVPFHELRAPIHELQVQIHELRVQIHELRVQIHELGD